MKSLHLLCVTLLLATLPAVAQDAPCSIPLPSSTSTSPNIFNDKQEQDLGDALAEVMEPQMTLLSPASSDEITKIGEKLLATLPSTGAHYTFRIYESGEINAFSTVGGRVYISRKLITAVGSEDELAGVIAHEIGHLYAHHTAIVITRQLRLRLGVTQVGDRADIFAKLHQLYSTPPTQKELAAEDVVDANEVKDELLADKLAFYELVHTGYNPEKIGAFLDKITLNNGKTGNWLTDTFGMTDDDSKRYRANLKMMAKLPENCKPNQTRSQDDFLAWQKTIIENNNHVEAVTVSGDKPLKLNSPLQPDLWRIRFSPDGHYVLAQDENSISVVDRNQAKVLFQIDAPDAKQAEFSPDSASVVFHTPTLRIEKWDIPTQKRISVKEMVVLDNCTRTALSPDGNTLLCEQWFTQNTETPHINEKLLDVVTGTTLWEKPNFFEHDFNDDSLYDQYVRWYTTQHFSPDGRYLLITAGNDMQAFDLQQREPIDLGGKLKSYISQTLIMAFVGANEFLVATSNSPNKGVLPAQVLSFPDGKVLQQTQVIANDIDGVTKGHLLITRPIQDHAAGILDYEHGNLIGVSKFPAMDIYDRTAAAESGTGELSIGAIGDTNPTRIKLPIGQMPELQDEDFSADGRYLAVSLKSRAEIWDLQTNKGTVISRPFRSVWILGQDEIYAQLPKYIDQDPQDLKLTMDPVAVTKMGKYDDDEIQYRDMQYQIQGNGYLKDQHVTLEVKKMGSTTIAWSKDYPHERPACWGAEDGRFVLAWDLASDTAKAEIKSYPALQKEAAALKNAKKGLLIETVALETGAPLQQVLIPEIDLTEGQDDMRHAWISGDYALVRNPLNDSTGIYKLDDGTKAGEFFGFPLATDAASGLIAAGNREGEVILLDEHTGKELQRFMLGSAVRAARIVNGNELMVLTADQIVHRLPLPKSDSAQPTSETTPKN